MIQKILEWLFPISKIPLWAKCGSIKRGIVGNPSNRMFYDENKFDHIQFPIDKR
jgi:hypothetical protein